jgi:hypothetical protein
MLSRACSRRPSSPLSGITSRPAPRVLLLAVCCQWSAVCCLVAPRAAPGPTIIPCPHYLPGINDLPLPPNAPHHTAGVCAEHVQRPAGEPATHLLACRPQLMRLSNLRSPPADQTRPDSAEQFARPVRTKLRCYVMSLSAIDSQSEFPSASIQPLPLEAR